MNNPFAGVRPVTAVIFLCAVMICAGGLLYDTARQQGRAEAERAAYASKSARLSRAATAACAGVRMVAACTEAAEAKFREADREEEAVRWQRDAARWSWWAVVLSLIQGVVGGAGLIAVLRSLRHSDYALKEARIANSLAKDASENELRAWIEIDFEMHVLSSVEGNPRVSGTAKLVNKGATPAVDLSYYLGLAIGGSVEAALQNTITDYVSGAIDWSDEMLFANADIFRSAETVHDGLPPAPDVLHVFMVAAYKTVFSEKIRITARAWDLSHPSSDGAKINFRKPPGIGQLLITTSRTARAVAH